MWCLCMHALGGAPGFSARRISLLFRVFRGSMATSRGRGGGAGGTLPGETSGRKPQNLLITPSAAPSPQKSTQMDGAAAPVVVAGAGIGGLALALALQGAGIPVIVLEKVRREPTPPPHPTPTPPTPPQREVPTLTRARRRRGCGRAGATWACGRRQSRC